MEVTFGGDVSCPTRPSPSDQQQSEDGSGPRADGAAAEGGTSGEFRGEEDLDDDGNGLSLISSSARAAAGNDGISGAYDAGNNATCPVEPFNLKAEREGGEGYFDGDAYVFRKFDEGGRGLDEEPDAWLDELGGGRDADGGGKSAFGTDDAEAGMARLSRAGTSSSSAAKTRQPKLDLDDVPTEVLCGRTAALLAGDKETVAGALKRYGDVGKRRKKSRKKEDGRSDAGEEDEEGIAAARKALSELTDLADAILMGGDGDVYSRTKEELAKMASAAGGDNAIAIAGQKRKRDYFADNGEACKAAAAASASENKVAVQWEYRGNEDHQTHGPYSTEQMLGWIEAGYFVGDAAVDVRRITPKVDDAGHGNGAATVATANDLMADLMDSDDDDEKGGEYNSAAKDDGWERSDEVNFASFLV